MKVRVSTFGGDAKYYSIEYKRRWSWEYLTKAWTIFDSPGLCTRNQPVLLESFEEAKQLAGTLTEQTLKEWIEREDKKYQDRVSELNIKITERAKSVEFEVQ